MKKLKDRAKELRRKVCSALRNTKRLRDRLRSIRHMECLELGKLRELRNGFRAEMLKIELEDRLKASKDPQERMELHSLIDLIGFMDGKGADVPKSLDEFRIFAADLFAATHMDSLERVKPLLMSARMLHHAARAEKTSQKN